MAAGSALASGPGSAVGFQGVPTVDQAASMATPPVEPAPAPDAPVVVVPVTPPPPSDTKTGTFDLEKK